MKYKYTYTIFNCIYLLYDIFAFPSLAVTSRMLYLCKHVLIYRVLQCKYVLIYHGIYYSYIAFAIL